MNRFADAMDAAYYRSKEYFMRGEEVIDTYVGDVSRGNGRRQFICYTDWHLFNKHVYPIRDRWDHAMLHIQRTDDFTRCSTCYGQYLSPNLPAGAELDAQMLYERQCTLNEMVDHILAYHQRIIFVCNLCRSELVTQHEFNEHMPACIEYHDRLPVVIFDDSSTD